jgi:Protein of unknown function (DUF2911)
MKMIRLQPVIGILLIFFISCKENKKLPVANPAPTIDSNSIHNTNDEVLINRYAPVDVSPMDMSYFPVDYPKLKMTSKDIGPPVARVIYSRPHLEGRQLFHDVLKYGERWRLGANEATELDLYRDVTIQSRKIKPGRYVLYCILGPGKWSLVLNGNIDSWGLTQDTTKDIQHFEIPVTHGNPTLEFFTMVFEKKDTGADLIMAWDDVVAKLPIDF